MKAQLFILFVAVFCAVVYLIRDAWRVLRSPEFRREHEQLREMKRRRREARRNR